MAWNIGETIGVGLALCFIFGIWYMIVKARNASKTNKYNKEMASRTDEEKKRDEIIENILEIALKRDNHTVIASYVKRNQQVKIVEISNNLFDFKFDESHNIVNYDSRVAIEAAFLIMVKKHNIVPSLDFGDGYVMTLGKKGKDWLVYTMNKNESHDMWKEIANEEGE